MNEVGINDNKNLHEYNNHFTNEYDSEEEETECGKVIYNKGELTEHGLMGGFGFECEPCGQVYFYKADLKKNIKKDIAQSFVRNSIQKVN